MHDFMSRLGALLARIQRTIDDGPEDHGLRHAVEYLRTRGHAIVSRHYATEHGPVAVLSLDGTLVFVDAHATLTGTHPRATLTRTAGEEVNARRRIAAWINDNPIEAYRYSAIRQDRFAVIVTAAGELWRIEHRQGTI